MKNEITYTQQGDYLLCNILEQYYIHLLFLIDDHSSLNFFQKTLIYKYWMDWKNHILKMIPTKRKNDFYL